MDDQTEHQEGGMADREFIEYCRMHSETERALFSAMHINRLFTLAGRPPPLDNEAGFFVSMYAEEMHPLCDLAEARLEGRIIDQGGTSCEGPTG